MPPEQVLGISATTGARYPRTLVPHTIALLDVLFEGGPDERFEFGLDIIVRGLAATAASTD